MKTINRSQESVQTSKSQYRLALLVAVLLLVLAAGIFLATSLRVVSISGRGESFVLQPNQLRLGILIIEDDASAIFHEKSHWIGPIISMEGALTVENDAAITGPVVLFSNNLRLGQNASVNGSVVLFAGGLVLDSGAIVCHHAVLFAGDVSIGQQASIRGHIVTFVGNVLLHEEASLRGDAVLFAGDMEIGSRAVAYGKPVLFAGGLELASDAVLRGGAVLFFGNVHLHEGAQVRGDVILVEGDATLDDQSVILGKLYLNPESNLGRERLYQSSSAEITRGVIQSENIMSVAGWRVGGWVMVHVFSFILLAVWILGLLIVFIFYLGRLSNLLKQKNAARARYTQPNPQLTSLD